MPLSKDEAIAQLEAYQERLERAARAGASAYDDLFDNAPPGLGLHEIDALGVITRSNGRERELLGYAEDQIVGHHASELVVMQEASQRSMERKLSGAELKPFVRSLKRADGSAVTVALVERHIKDAAGNVIRIRTALMEISA